MRATQSEKNMFLLKYILMLNLPMKAAGLSTRSSDCGSCSSGYTPIVTVNKQTKCFKYKELNNLDEAKAICESDNNAVLPRPQSKVETDSILSLINIRQDQILKLSIKLSSLKQKRTVLPKAFPIDLRYDKTKLDFTDLNGQKVASTEWIRTQLSYSGNVKPNFESFIFERNNKWIAVDGNSIALPIVCEQLCPLRK